MKTQAVLMGMEYYDPQECEITKVVTLSDGDYDYFRNHLYEKYDFLQQNQEHMARIGATPRCLLVMGEHSQDGILVDGDRSGRASHTAHFPEAAAYVQAHALEMNGDMVALRMLSQDDVIIMEARHVLWQYKEDGGQQADFSDCYLSALDFSDAQFSGASFRGALLEDCDLTGAGMCSCDFTGARFVHCKANDLVAEGCDFTGAVILDSTFQSARLGRSDFTGVMMDNNDFWEANLDYCTMDGDDAQEGGKLEQGCSPDLFETSQGCEKEESWEHDHICPTCMVAMGGMC